jgi:hypothetical protein
MSNQLKPLVEGLGPLFSDLERRVQATVELAAKVRETLSGPEKEHVISASCRESTLVIVTDSAAWASHIRYAQAALLEGLRARGETQFTKLRVKVGRRSC